jgi:hypothetical protein
LPHLEQTYEDREAVIKKAIGSTVIAAAGLERTLVGEIYRMQRLADLPTEDVEAFETLSGGKLLGKLRKQGIDDALAVRIDDLLVRRNKLVHGFLDDIEVARSLMNGDGFDEVRSGVERLGTECGVLAKEMQSEIAHEIEAVLGMPLKEIARRLTVADLSQVEDPKQRAELAKARILIELTGWPNSPLYDNGAERGGSP